MVCLAVRSDTAQLSGASPRHAATLVRAKRGPGSAADLRTQCLRRGGAAVPEELAQRSASSGSPIGCAARPSACSARRKPRFGSCSHGHRARGPASRCGAARRGRGGSRCGRRRRTRRSRPGVERLLGEHRPRRAATRGARRRPRRRAAPASSAARGVGSSGRRVGGGAEQVRGHAGRFSPGMPSACVRPDPGAGGAQVLAGLDDARGHAGLGGLAPGARVVGLLVADLAVDLQHAVVVREHVVGDRPGEGVLGVGVDVHLDHAVVDRGSRSPPQRAGAAVEDEVERLASPGRTSAPTASWISLRISGRSLTLPGL